MTTFSVAAAALQQTQDLPAPFSATLLNDNDKNKYRGEHMKMQPYKVAI